MSSAPMDISIPDAAAAELRHGVVDQQNGNVLDPTLSLPSPFPSPQPPPATADDKIPVSVEVCLKPTSTGRIEDVRSAIERMLENRNMSYVDGPIPVPLDDSFLLENVQRTSVCDTGRMLHSGFKKQKSQENLFGNLC